MTRRKHPPPKVDPDDYGFDVAGKGFRTSQREVLLLLGLDLVSCGLYMRCLKPFADRTGKVRAASFYRFRQLLKPVQSPGGGRRMPEPSRRQLERAIERLVHAGLITSYATANGAGRALQIRLQEVARSSPKV